MNSTDDLNYVNKLLKDSESNGYPAIYIFWGVIIFLGFALNESKPEWASAYWISATIIGLFVCTWIGWRQANQSGQRDSGVGMQYLKHFGIMTACIFLAMYLKDYRSILLIIGLSHCLAGLYLERIMLLVSVVTLACYVGVIQGLITSSLVVGSAMAGGLFVAAWATSRKTD